MKRTLIPGLMLLAAFTLTNCSEQLVPPVQEDDVIVEETPSTEATEEEILGIPFEVYANASDEEVDTKTTNVGGGNYTAWEATDAIYVYHAPAGSTSGFTKNHKFSMRNLAENLFGGALYKDANLNATSSYDWYFIYPNKEEGSGSAGTQSTVNANLVIGAAESDGYIQTQKPIKVKTGEVENTLYSNKNHIAGVNYPMYGKASVKGDENPRIKMKHLSALVALKIVNQGDGVEDNGDSSIEINNVEFVAPEEVVGNFNVTVSQTPIKYDKVAASATAIVNLADANGKGITIGPNDEALVYFAVKPFTAKKDAKITIKINGSPRTVPMPKDINFEAGKVTTLRVPVKLSYPKASDAMKVTGSQGDKVLTFPVSEQDLNANGEIVKGYVVGDGGFQELIIIGTTTDIVRALDVGFYASTWQGRRAAMTVSNVNVWMPNSDGSLSKIKDYKPLKNILTSEIKDDLGWAGFLAGTAVEVVMGTLSNGIPRDDQGSLSFIYLTKFIDPQTITFNGVVENGSAGSNEAMLFLDESPIYKEIKAESIDALLSTRFSYNGQIPTYAGLLDIINGKNTTEANTTAEILYNKLYDVVAGKGSLSMSAAGVNFTINLSNVFKALISDANDLKAKLPKMKFQIDVSTCPYREKKTDYGSKASPITLETMKTWTDPKNPIIFWGLDMYGPDRSTL